MVARPAAHCASPSSVDGQVNTGLNTGPGTLPAPMDPKDSRDAISICGRGRCDRLDDHRVQVVPLLAMSPQRRRHHQMPSATSNSDNATTNGAIGACRHPRTHLPRVCRENQETKAEARQMTWYEKAVSCRKPDRTKPHLTLEAREHFRPAIHRGKPSGAGAVSACGGVERRDPHNRRGGRGRAKIVQAWLAGDVPPRRRRAMARRGAWLVRRSPLIRYRDCQRGGDSGGL